ncbi:hypothetical protein ABZ299_15060 [Streptomyces sp. NPDC006184]|uniref:hypothetical protein n=1 Tax=Streptomyces sp. NPDC006184 TaxID=3155455 RepID=UPI0033BE4ED9
MWSAGPGPDGYALAAAHPGDTTTLRRRLLGLSVRLWWHPCWQTVPSAPAARCELRRLARARETVQAT